MTSEKIILCYRRGSPREMLLCAVFFSLGTIAFAVAGIGELTPFEAALYGSFLAVASAGSIWCWWELSASFEVDRLGITMKRFGRSIRLAFDEIERIEESALGGFGAAGRSRCIKVYDVLPDYHWLLDHLRARASLAPKVELPVIVKTSWLMKVIVAKGVLIGGWLLAFGILDRPGDTLDHIARPIVILLGLGSIAAGTTLIPLRYRIDRQSLVESFLLRRKRHDLGDLLSLEIEVDAATHRRSLVLRFRGRCDPVTIDQGAVGVPVPALLEAIVDRDWDRDRDGDRESRFALRATRS